MSVLQLSVYAMAMGICVFTGILAWRTLFAHRAFFIFLALLVLMLGCDWLLHYPGSPFKSLWLLGLMGATLLVAPCVLQLAYGTGLVHDRFVWRQQLALVIGGWVLLIPLSTAIHGGTEFINTQRVTSVEHALFIHTTMLASAAVFIVQTVITLRICLRLLRERSEQNRALFSTFDDPGLGTLRLLVLIVLANAGIAICRVLYCALLDDVYIGLSFLITFSQLGMIMFLALSFIQQQVRSHTSTAEALRGQIFEQVGAKGEAITLTKIPSENTTEKYNKSKATLARNKAIYEAIEKVMDQEHLFQQPGLSLRDLCGYIGESPHAVSQAINTSDYENFYDLVNQRRISLAANMLATRPSMSVLDVAFECGFNAKSSFNSVFKRYKAMTPSQYRAQCGSNTQDLG